MTDDQFSTRDVTDDDSVYDVQNCSKIGQPCERCDLGVYLYNPPQKQTYNHPYEPGCVFCSCCDHVAE